MEPTHVGTYPDAPWAQVAYVTMSFLVPMVIALIFLLPAGSRRRKPATAIALRVCAVILVLFVVYAAALGGGRFDPGGIAAAVVTVSWAIWQQVRKKQLPSNNSLQRP
jgi:peptidoglycan/LPS O-acetylase OafA/YrhL